MSKTVESNAESSNSPVTSTNEKSGLQGDDALLVEKILNKLLSATTAKPRTLINFDLSDIEKLCYLAREVFLQQPMLVETTAPLVICGDTHGQVLRFIENF